MSLRSKVAKLAIDNPGPLREALVAMLVEGSPKFNALIPYLERLYPETDASRLLSDMQAGRGKLDDVVTDRLDALALVEISDLHTKEGEYELWHDSSPMSESSLFSYTYADKIGVKATMKVSARDMGAFLSGLSSPSPDGRSLMAVVTDRKFQAVMATVLQNIFGFYASDGGEWWVGDFEKVLAKDYIDDEHFESSDFPSYLVTPNFTSGRGSAKVTPDGRGGYNVEINGVLGVDLDLEEPRRGDFD